MTALRTIAFVAAAMLVIALVVIITSQQRLISNLRAEKRQETPELAEIQATLIQKASPERRPEEEALSRDNLDLLRLRNEVHQLREQQKELEQVRLENARLKVLAQSFEQRRFLDANRNPIPAVPRPNAYIGVVLAAQGTSGSERVLINSVMPDSPASEAQLQLGDLILAVNAEPVTGLVQLRTRIGNSAPGQPLTLQVLRDNITRYIAVVPRTPPP